MDFIKEHGYIPINPEDKFQFQCKMCGDCCRNVKDAIMLESLDLFRIAQHLGKETAEVSAMYADVGFLSWGFPILLLKTKAYMDVCVFLKSGKCSINSAKPRVCRTYPLGVGPVDNNQDFAYFIVSKKTHHFTGESHCVRNWFDENLNAEDREFMKLDVRFADEFGQAMKGIKEDDKLEKEIMSLILLYKYFMFDIAEPFMRQYTRNMAILSNKLKKFGG